MAKNQQVPRGLPPVTLVAGFGCKEQRRGEVLGTWIAVRRGLASGQILFFDFTRFKTLIHMEMVKYQESHEPNRQEPHAQNRTAETATNTNRHGTESQAKALNPSSQTSPPPAQPPSAQQPSPGWGAGWMEEGGWAGWRGGGVGACGQDQGLDEGG